jgi:ADP-ribose pyrophosphatase YjhB (NUDIX family)
VFRSLPRGVRRRLVRLLTPNYTVGAVVLVRDQDGALLLLRQPPGHGWSLPGGLLNHRELAARGAARELAEETGIEVDPDTLAPASPNARINAVAQQVDVVFTATVDSRSTEVRIDPVEVLEAGWHPLDRLPPLTVATARLLALYDIGPYARYADDGAPRSAPDQPAAPDQADQAVAADDPAAGAP